LPPSTRCSTASLGLLNENGCWLQTKAALRASFLSTEAKKYVEHVTWPTIFGVFFALSLRKMDVDFWKKAVYSSYPLAPDT